MLERAAALLPAGDTARLELLPELAEALFVAGKLAQGQAVCEEAIEAAERQGDRRTRAHALVVLVDWGLITGQEGEADRAQRVAEDARAVFEEAGDELGLARAWSLFGQSGWARGQMNPAHAAFKRALEHAQRAQHERLQAQILDFANAALLCGPAHVDEVTRQGEQTLDWARANGNRYLEANTLGYPLGLSDAMRGRLDRARRQIVEAKAILEDLGLLLWRGHVSHAAGYVELLAGDPSAAEREWREGYELLEATGDRYVQPLNAAGIALALCLQNRWSEADHWATVSEELAPARLCDTPGMVAHCSHDACSPTRGTGRKRAGSRRRQRQRFAARTSFYRADIYVTLAEALREVGETAAAREHAREALRNLRAEGPRGRRRQRARAARLRSSREGHPELGHHEGEPLRRRALGRAQVAGVLEDAQQNRVAGGVRLLQTGHELPSLPGRAADVGVAADDERGRVALARAHVVVRGVGVQDGSELRIRRVAVLDRELGRVRVARVSHEVDERHERDDDAEEVRAAASGRRRRAARRCSRRRGRAGRPR